MARILLIDDEPDFSDMLRGQLQRLGHEVHWLDLAEEGLRLLADEPCELVLLDNIMPRMSGLEFLKAMQDRAVSVPVILMTSAHHDRTAIQAINLGAFDYVIKPETSEEILPQLEPILLKALEITRRPKPVPLPAADSKDAEDDSLIVGQSKAIREVLVRIGELTRVDETVLILGETGTGKDLVARAIHTNSARQKMPFVVVNCSALHENLEVAELFGHERHAFTGAEKMRKGHFEHANGGTLFLDEVGDMPLPLQAKLLRVLENREITRLGSSEPIRVDVRILSATHRDLKALVHEGKFRQDLFFRLEGMTIRLPPLRERKEDVGRLARCFLGRMFGGGSSVPRLHPDALAALTGHAWPGNIRQLQKVLARAAGVARGKHIVRGDLDFGELDAAGSTSNSSEPATAETGLAGLRRAIAWAWHNKQPEKPWARLLAMLECELLRHALGQPYQSLDQLAEQIGISKTTVIKWKKIYDLT